MSISTPGIESSQDTHAPFGAASRALQVAVIIPALNEEAHIAQCLQSLVSLSSSSVSFEVIIVDNGSSDRTLEIVNGFREDLNLTTCRLAGVPISALRNLGVDQTTAPVVAFLDADCIVPPRWLEHLVALVDQVGQTSVIGCRYEIPPQSSWVARAWERGQAGNTPRSVRYVPGGDMAMHRSAFIRLGGFDESLRTNEDAELCKRARNLGLSVIADPALAVVHLGTSQTLSHFYRRQYWHGTHVFKVFRRAPFHSGNEKAVLLALYTLALQISVAISMVICAITGAWIPVLLTGALAITPAILLASIRVRTTRAWSDLPFLILLFTVYGLARAHCLLRIDKA